MTQRDVWELILEHFKTLKKNKVKFVYRVEIEELFKSVEKNNKISIPLDWKIKLRNRLNNYLEKGLI